MKWLAVKTFFKKAWRFIADQWLFFLTTVVGIIGFVLGSRDSSKIEEVLDLKNKGEAEEQAAQRKAKEDAEFILKKLDEGLQSLDDEQREIVERLQKENKDEFEKEILDNREQPLSALAAELAAKHGLHNVGGER